MPTLQLQLFGHFQLLVNGAPVQINQVRLQSLLAYLFLHPTSLQTRQHLAFVFWPDSTEAQARANLRKALYDLHRVLPDLDRYLPGEQQDARWQTGATVQLDVTNFEELLAEASASGETSAAQAVLEQAVTLYTGDLLPTCYDDWALRERERLRQRYLSGLEQLVNRLEERREYGSAAGYAERLLQADPLRETTYRVLMRLYVEDGDRARALRVYHTCATILQQELGVEPDGETQAAYRRLLNLEAPTTVQSAVVPPAASVLSLVGRQREWEALRSAWRTTCRGQPHCVLIAGEAGIGKTRLAEELLHWVEQQGYLAARTRSYAAEGQLAYAPIADWLRADAIRSRLTRLEPVWLSETARLLPELLVEHPDLAPPQPLADSWQRQRFREALARAFIAGEQPLLLVLDDLQWCDQESLEWLHYLLRFVARAKVLVVGTVRPEEVGAAHPLHTLLMNLRQDGKLLEFELEPLDGVETAALAALIAGHPLDAGESTALYVETEGHPLFVIETMRAREASASFPVLAPTPVGLSPTVQAVIGARLLQLTPATRELAELAAVVGRAFTVEVLAHAGASDEDALVRGLDELWQRRIIREQGVNTYDFSHDRIREAAYAGISPMRCRMLHHRVAEALEQVYAVDLDALSAQIAAHYEHAGVVATAVRWYREASAAAKRLYAHGEAVGYLERALAVVQSSRERARLAEIEIDLLHSIGYARIVTYGWGSAPVGAAWEQALAMARRAGTPFQLCRSLHVYASFLRNHGELRLLVQYDKEMLRVAEEHGVDDRYLKICYYGSLTTYYYIAGRFGLVLEYSRARDALYEGGRVERSFEWYADTQPPGPGTTDALALWNLGYADQTRAICRAELDWVAKEAVAADHPDFVGDLSGYTFPLMICVHLRDLEQVRILAEELIERATRAKYELYLNDGKLYKGYGLAHQGRLNEGLALVRWGVEARIKRGFQMFAPYDRALLAETLALAGETKEALGVADEGLALADANDHVFWNAHLLRLKGDFLLMLNAPEAEVENWYLAALDVAQVQGSRMLALRAATALARLWQVQGRSDEAHDLLAPLYAEFTEGFDTPDLTDARALLEELSKE